MRHSNTSWWRVQKDLWWRWGKWRRRNNNNETPIGIEKRYANMREDDYGQQARWTHLMKWEGCWEETQRKRAWRRRWSSARTKGREVSFTVATNRRSINISGKHVTRVTHLYHLWMCFSHKVPMLPCVYIASPHAIYPRQTQSLTSTSDSEQRIRIMPIQGSTQEQLCTCGA